MGRKRGRELLALPYGSGSRLTTEPLGVSSLRASIPSAWLVIEEGRILEFQFAETIKREGCVHGQG
jgi:hypothetical protein